MTAPWITERFEGASIEPVSAGWSDDQKYKIETSTGSCLLRVSPADAYLRKQDEFAQLARLNEKTDAFSEAVEHGLSPDGQSCFVLYQWMEGAEALKVFPNLTEEQQFRHGVTAGKLLRIIHDLPQNKVVDSHAIISAKMAVRRQQMRELDLEFKGYETMIEFLERNLHLLKDTPTAFRHGDFHLGNMLIDREGRLRIIDFNRSDFGDPLEDFNRLFTFSRKTSVAFARGQIEGYFQEIPPTFFSHALCYVLMDCAFGLIWSKRFGQKEINVHFSLVEQIMNDFDQLKTTRPEWVLPTRDAPET